MIDNDKLKVYLLLLQQTLAALPEDATMKNSNKRIIKLNKHPLPYLHWSPWTRPIESQLF